MKIVRKYKVIEEYDRYYLAEDSETKAKECFNKPLFIPDKEGFISKAIEDYGSGPSKKRGKINKSFNQGIAKITKDKEKKENE